MAAAQREAAPPGGDPGTAGRRAPPADSQTGPRAGWTFREPPARGERPWLVEAEAAAAGGVAMPPGRVSRLAFRKLGGRPAQPMGIQLPGFL